MFKGKVILYENKNGQEKKLEKEFDNMRDYQGFLKEYDSQVKRLNHDNPWESMRSMFQYINDVVDRRFGLPTDEYVREVPELVDMTKYDQAVQEMARDEQTKQQKEEERKLLIDQYQDDLDRLDQYGKQLEKDKTKHKQLLKELEDDKNKIKEEIKKLQNS